MKKLKKLSIVLCMVLSISILFSGSVFATDIEPRYVPDSILLTIYAGDTLSSSLPEMDFGHSYITVENFCQKPITVGKMSVASGKGISLGTWNDDKRHDGLWYNRELKVLDRDYYQYSQVITESQLAKLNAYVNNPAQNSWSVSKTCTSFAIGAWNSTGLAKKFANVLFPAELIVAINYLPNSDFGHVIDLSYPVYYVDKSTGVLTKHKDY